MLTHIKTLLRDNSLFLAVLCTLGIAILSLVKIPSDAVPSIDASDKFLHGLAYFFLSIFWLVGVQKNGAKTQTTVLVIFVCFIYGIVLEAVQGVMTAYRTASYYDILANSTGIFVAFLVFRWIDKKKS